MKIQTIKNKISFLVITILALFCLVNCDKSEDNSIEELKGLKKSIDFTKLNFNEAQEKLVKTYVPDFPKDSETIKSNSFGAYEELYKAIERCSLETRQGIQLSDNILYFKKNTKKPFTGIFIYPRLYSTDEQVTMTENYMKNKRDEIIQGVKEGYIVNSKEFYIKDGREILSISYDSGKKYFNNENCLRLLDYIKVADDKGNEVYYSFKKDFVNTDYAKEQGIPLEYDQCPQLRVTETVNGIIVKITYYYYNLETGKFITKYEEGLPEDLELARTAKVTNREIIEDDRLVMEKIFADAKK